MPRTPAFAGRRDDPICAPRTACAGLCGSAWATGCINRRLSGRPALPTFVAGQRYTVLARKVTGFFAENTYCPVVLRSLGSMQCHEQFLTSWRELTLGRPVARSIPSGPLALGEGAQRVWLLGGVELFHGSP